MNSKSELIANIALTVIGIIGGTSLFFLDARELSSIFFAIALASILYQFLGGIGDTNSFKLGAIKFGGSAAVLGGFVFFLNELVFIANKTEVEKINYSEKKWIPISTESGKTLSPPLTINNGTYTDTFPKPSDVIKRGSHHFKVEESENGKFTIYTRDGSDRGSESIGVFSFSDIKSTSLFNDVAIDDSESLVQTFTLKPDFEDLNSTSDIQDLHLPFEIVVFNGSRFKVLINNQALDNFQNREVIPRHSYIIPVSKNEIYVAFLEQAANVINDNYPERYSKWLVKKLKKTIAVK